MLYVHEGPGDTFRKMVVIDIVKLRPYLDDERLFALHTGFRAYDIDACRKLVGCIIEEHRSPEDIQELMTHAERFGL